MQSAKDLYLPQELLDQIFQDLDIESLLSLQLTCRSFYAATASLWLHLAREIQSRPQSPRSEEPLEDYTPQELQRWVVRRHQVEQIWNTHSIPEFRMRFTECAVDGQIVLPGGRWSLSFSEEGELIGVDMDSPEMKPKVLTKIKRRTRGIKIADRLDWLTVWVDPHEPRLTFRVTAVKYGYLTRDGPAHGRTCAYIFYLRLLGHGKDAVLSVERFRRFEGQFFGNTDQTALNGLYFIQLKTDHEMGYSNLHVFNYEKDSVITVRLPWCDSRLITDMFFLPGDKVAIAHRDSINFYAIPTSPEVSDSEWSPLRTISLDWNLAEAQGSEPYIGETSTTIISYRHPDIVALILPHDPNENHTIIPIARCSFYLTRCGNMGLFYAVNPEPNHLELLRYLWDPLSDDGVRGFELQRRGVDLPGRTLFVRSFHGAIGRLVTVMGGGLRIYDVIPAKKTLGTQGLQK